MYNESELSYAMNNAYCLNAVPVKIMFPVQHTIQYNTYILLHLQSCL